MMTNFTATRAAIFLTDSEGVVIENETLITKAEEELLHGDNVLYPNEEDRELHYVINGKDTDRRIIFMTISECVNDCGGEAVVEEELSDEFLYWSKPSSWPSGAVPVEGDDVVIESGVNMILDVNTEIMNSLEINGRLTFLNNETDPLDLTLSSKLINIRAGELFIGNETHPFNGQATVMLNGRFSEPSLLVGLAQPLGNKVMAVTGTAKLFGQPRDNMSRLRATCFKGDTSVTVFAGLDW